MDEVVLELLQRLEAIGDEHEEIYDSDVREAMSNALFFGFIRPAHDFELAGHFEMFTPDGNARVRETLAWFIPLAQATAEREGIDTFRKRLNAFQNDDLCTGRTSYFDDFFGWWNPERFNEQGDSTG